MNSSKNHKSFSIQNTSATSINYSDFFNMQETSGTNTAFLSPFGLVFEGGKCICCGKETQTQLAGYWAHVECARQVAEIIKLAEAEIPTIRLQIIMTSRKCLEASILSFGTDKFEAIRKDVENKAWKIFKERHPLPWKKKNSFGEEASTQEVCT